MQNNIHLTDEEKRIIADFISCAVGEGYSGDKKEYDTENIEGKLITISEKLGFSRNKLGIDYAICKLDFEKDNIRVRKGERCYYNEMANSVHILTENKNHLTVTLEEANKYF